MRPCQASFISACWTGGARYTLAHLKASTRVATAAALRDHYRRDTPKGGILDVDINVRVVPDTEKSTAGVIDADVSIEQIRADIVEDLGLGDADDWDIAITPANKKNSLASYKPAPGDTIFLISRKVARGSSFRRA
jgi:hypothetical protein